MPATPSTRGPTDAGFDELRAKALRPSSVEVHIDPVTYDRLFVVRFEDHEPLHLVVGPTDLASILTVLSRAIAKSLN